MNRKKLFYVPGLLSLVGLPVLLCLFPPEDPVSQNVVKLHLPSEDRNYDAKDGVLPFSHAGIMKGLKGKKVEQVYLNYNVGDDEISNYILNRKLSFIKQEMERLQFTHDTATVLKISFGSENTYGQYMYIQNLAILDRYRRYALDDYDFYLFSEAPPVCNVTVDSGLYPDDSYSNTDNHFSITSWDILSWKIQYKWQALVYQVTDNKLFCSGFFILIALPFFISFFRLRLQKKAPPEARNAFI